jgi:subtilisin-like proprotein convertase family protein
MRKILSAITAFLVVACFNNMFIIGQTTTTQNPDSGLPAAIPDNNPAGVNLPFTFSGLSGSLTNVRVEGMTWSPVHTWSGDLTATLTAPGGSPTATIFQRKGRATPCTSGAGSASDLTGPYTFRDDPTGSPGNFHTIATNPVPSGQYQATRCVTTAGEVILMDGIFAGPVFGPDYLVGKNFYGTEEKGLESFRNMSPEAANGTWILNINDQASGDVGTVTAIQLSLGCVDITI